MKRGFRQLALSKISKCNTIEEYRDLRILLKQYGNRNFYQEMEKFKIFACGKISKENNPFIRMLLGERSDEYQDLGDFILINCNYNKSHKLLTPKLFNWATFNVLTLDDLTNDLSMLYKMKDIATRYINDNQLKNFGLYFHCYPFNSVNTLHLHIVDLDDEPEFQLKKTNLNLNDVIKQLENEVSEEKEGKISDEEKEIAYF